MGQPSAPQQSEAARAAAGPFHVRLGKNADDLARVVALRRARFGVGADNFDDKATQVLIENGNQLVGAFRLRHFATGRDMARSYSAQFYDLADFQRLAAPALELGRFCVQADFSGQTDVLRLAFAAMAALVDRAGAAMLFGCASFQGTDFGLHRASLSLLKPHIGTQWKISKIAAQGVDLKTLSHISDEAPAALRGIPPLLRSYLSIGGWVGDHAVQDFDLGTIHVFTAVAVADIPPARAAALRAIAQSLTLE